MSVGFEVTIARRKLFGVFPVKADFQKAASVAETLAKEWDADIAFSEGGMTVSFCPEGDLFFVFDSHSLKGNTTSSIAGPGFHAAAVDFCDALAAHCTMTAIFKNEDPYVKRRDFKALQQEEFLPYLGGLLNLIEQQSRQGGQELYIAWPIDRYHLEKVPENFWICPTGIYPDSAKLKFDRAPKEFAQDFFIWPNREKDAYHHRNAAMSLAWTSCSFLPEDSLCDYIRKALETAAQENPTLPFPQTLYRELCEICSQPPVVPDMQPEDNRFPTIGFRKFPLREPLYSWELLLPGGFGRYDEPSGTVDFFGPDRTMFASTLACNLPPGEEERFCREALENVTAKDGQEKIQEFQFEKMRAVLSKVSQEDWEYPYLLFCAKVEPGHVLYLSCNIRDPEDYQWALDLLHNARCREYEKRQNPEALS